MAELVNQNVARVGIAGLQTSTGKLHYFEVNEDGGLTTTPSTSGSATTTTPTVTTSSSEVLAANANRKGALITNPGSTTVYLNFDAAATTSHHPLKGDGNTQVGAYTGSITAITASGTQALVVSEFTT